MTRALALFVVVIALSGSAAVAQTGVDLVDGIAPPIAPDTVTRDEKVRAVLRAVRIDRPLALDGRLDDEVYGRVQAIGGFIQHATRSGPDGDDSRGIRGAGVHQGNLQPDDREVDMWTLRLQSLARIVIGLLVLRHGMEQVLGFPAAFTPVETTSLHGVVKWLAFPGGILLMLGLFTRPVAVVLAPLYVAVWAAGPLREAFTGQDVYLGAGQEIWGRGPTDPLLLPALFFVYLFAAGPGSWSIDWLRNPEAAAKQLPWTPHALGVLRITAGLLFFPHGLEKFAGRIPVTLVSLRTLAGTLECVGGPLLAVGLFTRPIAFLLSGEMAFAYFLNHAPDGFWGSFVEPNQEAAILNCFLFLFLSAAGPGSFSLESYMKKRA